MSKVSYKFVVQINQALFGLKAVCDPLKIQEIPPSIRAKTSDNTYLPFFPILTQALAYWLHFFAQTRKF